MAEKVCVLYTVLEQGKFHTLPVLSIFPLVESLKQHLSLRGHRRRTFS